MSVSILEVLANAEHNLCKSNYAMQHSIGKEQLHNAVELLNKGYAIDDDFNEIMGDHDNVESVPDKIN